MRSFNVLITGAAMSGKTAFIERICGRQFPLPSTTHAPLLTDTISLNTTQGVVNLTLMELTGFPDKEQIDGVIAFINNTPYSQKFANALINTFMGPVVICRSMHDLPVSFTTTIQQPIIDISARTGYNLFVPLVSILHKLAGVDTHILSINNGPEIPPPELSYDILSKIPNHVVIPQPEYITRIYNINIGGRAFTIDYAPRELIVDYERGVFSIRF